ncbi:unnamed protein product [Caretta caretta]
MAANIKSTSQKVDQRLNANLRYTEWDTGDKVLFRYYSEKHHPLSPWWVGPVLIMNKASPTTYLVEIKRKMSIHRYIVFMELWFVSSSTGNIVMKENEH